MKDIKTRNILFISKTNIALVVFNKVDNENNILFAEQVALNSADLNVKISDLLTKAANFLDSNIKEVEIVFDDSNVQKVSFTNMEYPDCNDEDDLAKEIYKYAKLQNYYVNEINFNNIFYDDIEKKAVVNYEIVASNYETYKKYVKAANQCNLKVLNSTNIYTLINDKSLKSELVIRMLNGSTIVSQYNLSKLEKVTNFELKLNEIYSNLAMKYDLSIDEIKHILNLANAIEADVNTESILSTRFDIVHRKFFSIKACDIVQSYQDEISYMLSSQFKFEEFEKVTIITNDSINKLANVNILKPVEIIGLENIDPDKLFALAKLDANAKSNSHFKFENSLNARIRSIGA